MQFLGREDIEAVAAAMHRISQKKLPVALVGTGLPSSRLDGGGQVRCERLSAYPRIGHLTDVAAREALVGPVSDHGVRFEAGAGQDDRAVGPLSGVHSGRWQGGVEHGAGVAHHPRRRRVSGASCDRKVGRRVLPLRLEKATSERRYMAAMADLGEGPDRTRDIVKKLGGHSGASTYRDALIKKGLIFSPDFGLVDFTVPDFWPFMRRRYPFERALKR